MYRIEQIEQANKVQCVNKPSCSSFEFNPNATFLIEYENARANNPDFKNLINYSGDFNNITPLDKLQSVCNFNGGGQYRACCDPSKTSKISTQRLTKIIKSPYGEINEIRFCQCSNKYPDPVEKQKCIEEECSDYTNQITEYELCKSISNPPSQTSISQNKLMPDCLNTCPSSVIPQKIPIYDPKLSTQTNEPTPSNYNQNTLASVSPSPSPQTPPSPSTPSTPSTPSQQTSFDINYQSSLMFIRISFIIVLLSCILLFTL